MATTYYTDIQKLYVAYFSRPADPAGLAYWEGVVEASGGDTTTVSASFAASAEYTAAYSNMTNAQIVTAVYTNLFGHAPDAAGATYWANLLDSNTITMADAVTAIAGGAQGTDAVAYADKVTAASAFTAAVDTDAEKAGYSGADANTAAKAWLADVTDSTSLTAALDPASLATTVATVVAVGTPFTVAGALAALDAANTALDTYVTSLDLGNDSASDNTAAQIETAETTAIAKVAADMTGGAAGSSGSLFISTSSDTVRDALVNAQEATNAAALAAAQKVVATDNAAIAKIAGLSAATTTMTSATTAFTAAQKTATSADADLAAKIASFQVTNDGTISIATDADTGVKTVVFTSNDAGVDPEVLGTMSSTGKVTVTTGLDDTDYAGLTTLAASYNTDATAHTSVDKAQATLDSAHLSVNLLDIDTTTSTVGDTGMTEANLIAAISAQINDTTADTVATGATPTVAQIQTELAILQNTDTDAYTSFKAMVDAETADTTHNPLTAKLTTDTAAVTAVSKTIATLAKDVAALTTAESHASTLEGLQATVEADKALLTDKGYAVTTLDAASTTGTLFASAASDVYVTSGHDATISLFGLQGSDSLFVGTGYTVVNGLIGDTGIKGSDATMEIFIGTNSNGDAELQIETHAYSSSVTGTDTGEIVTIVLTGVDASTLHLGTDGIITTSAAATTA